MKKINSIFVVDDDEDDRFLVSEVIELSEISDKVFEAENGREALEFLQDYVENKRKYSEKFPPILVLLDINMPIMNGFEFLEAYGESFSGDNRYTPIIICMFSSSDSKEDIDKAFSFPYVKDYLTKPVTEESLMDLYSRHFEKNH